jgi:hypothetical protein
MAQRQARALTLQKMEEQTSRALAMAVLARLLNEMCRSLLRPIIESRLKEQDRDF